MAIWSLVLTILTLGGIGSIAGIWLGLRVRGRIDQTGERGGHGTWPATVAPISRWPALAGGRPRGQALISGGMSVSDSAGREVAESGPEVLLSFRTRVRDAVVRVSAGLTAEQQRTPVCRPGPACSASSGT